MTTDTTTTLITALDARADEIDLMPMPQRLAYLRAAQEAAAPFGAGQQWRIIEGVLRFFDARDLAAPGTWFSWVNSAVLEGIGRGVALAADDHADDYGNPGARMWASHVRRHSIGDLATPSARAHSWSAARLVGMDYGVALAARHNRTPSPAEARFLSIARIYNWAMANRAVTDGTIAFAGFFHSSLAGLDPFLVGRVFAVDDPAAADHALEIAFAAASLDPDPQLLQPALALLAPLLRQLAEQPPR